MQVVGHGMKGDHRGAKTREAKEVPVCPVKPVAPVEPVPPVNLQM